MSSAEEPMGQPQPTHEHERFKAFEGTFRAQVTIHMGPDQKMESVGTMVNELQLGGLYLHQDYQGDAIGDSSARFLGKGYWGYNTSSKQYEGFWIDNASTMMQIETGSVDESGKVWTMIGRFTHPHSGDAMVKKSVITLIDENHHRMESFFSQGNSDEHKAMEIAYERV